MWIRDAFTANRRVVFTSITSLRPIWTFSITSLGPIWTLPVTSLGPVWSSTTVTSFRTTTWRLASAFPTFGLVPFPSFGGSEIIVVPRWTRRCVLDVNLGCWWFITKPRCTGRLPTTFWMPRSLAVTSNTAVIFSSPIASGSLKLGTLSTSFVIFILLKMYLWVIV